MTADRRTPSPPTCVLSASLKLAGRTVEITDEDESIVIAFVPVDVTPARKP